MQEILSKIKIDKKFNPPNVLILYGPPASGKGTQADMIVKNLAHLNYVHLDFGQMLREFVIKNLKSLNLTESEIEKFENKDDKEINIAIGIYKKMKVGRAVDPDLVWFVAQETIENIIESKKRLVVDGVGRTIEDCKRLGKIIKNHDLSSAIFHICLTENEIIQRSVNRWYNNYSKISFPSYKTAKVLCKIDEEPWQRPDDTNVFKIRERFRNLYEEIYAKALSTLQTECLANLFIIDGHDSVEDTFKRILFYLDKFYT
jgi:adenylate kinase family enzyme